MKKYYRLVLVTVSVISLVSLLFYRHEYNRLRYVLEVLNFFGKPGELAVSSDCLTNSTFTTENISFVDSVPVWHRLNNDLFFYSAFLEESNKKKEQVKAIGVGRNPSRLAVGCRLWYENQEFSSEGRVSYTVIPMRVKQSILDKEKVFPYFILCASEVTLDSTPFAVEFYLEGHEANDVILPISSSEYNQDIVNSTLICISPSNKKTPPADIAEFIAFHQVLGITNYLVYDNGLLTPTSLLLLREKNLGFKVTIVPWDFPFHAAEASLTTMHWDCLLRAAFVKPAAVLHLSWNQLAVPRYHHSISSMVHDFDTHIATARFLLPTLRFCLEYPEQKSTVALRSQRHCYHADTKPSEEQEWALERPHLLIKGLQTQQRISRGIIDIHIYEMCNDVTSTQPLPPKKYDNSITRFSSELQQSKILKLWSRHHQWL